MLTDQEAEEIRRGLEGGTRGPVLIKWVRELLADRAARSRRLIRCDICETFEPVIEDATPDGQVDLLCGRCRHVVATMADGPA
jgi:hypothetical protein